MNQREIYRVVDVNANRAREGLRVVEEVTRFILEEPQFTACLKEIRHEISEALKSFPTKELLSARNSQGDVGRELYQPGEGRRDGYEEIIRTNMVRSQEALRALEEFSKVIDSRIGEKFKTIRFRLYSLEKEIKESLTIRKDKKGQVAPSPFPSALGGRTKVRGKGKFLGNQVLREWKLYIILDKELTGSQDPVEIVKAVAAGGGAAIQWRDKKGNTREAVKVVSQLKKDKSLKSMSIIINDRVDLVLATGADGVHLGQDDLPLSRARKLLGERIIGASTHSEEEALQAEKEGADYISLGPIFSTQTKEDAGSPLGVRKIEEVKKNVGIPLIAIGGINRTNIEEVIAAGADVV
ncbi:thiamine phosphate synthase, partial [candidate division NPL-UPA2 bacterium]|nr:thiamine phosphate synthase [candidate division NPL-UPA2 bacterium]